MFTFLVIAAMFLIVCALTAGLSLAFRDEDPEEPFRVEHHPLRLVRPQPYDWMNDD